MPATTAISIPDPATYSPQVEHIDGLLKLHRAAEKISSILDLEELIDKIVNDVAISFGYLEASIYLHDEGRGTMVLSGVHGCTMDCSGHSLRVGSEGMVGYVAATRETRYAPDVRLDPYYISCDDSTRSELAVPLHADGKLVGVFMASHHELDAFSSEQRRLLQALCGHIGGALHNARRFQMERAEKEKMSRDADEAAVMQRALFPRTSPLVPGFAVSGHSIPAGSVGGDWYDFVPLSDGRWGLVLADVAGKGTAAALLMAATRGILRSLAEAECSPAEVLTKLNRLLVEDLPPARFVTMIYGVLDPGSRTFAFANAGHLPPVLVSQDGARLVSTEKGMPLGLALGSFSECTVSLDKGSRLLLYSDGITEATNASDEEYGARRLMKHLEKPEASLESIFADVHAFTNGIVFCDDATAINILAQA